MCTTAQHNSNRQNGATIKLLMSEKEEAADSCQIIIIKKKISTTETQGSKETVHREIGWNLNLLTLAE